MQIINNKSKYFLKYFLSLLTSSLLIFPLQVKASPQHRPKDFTRLLRSLPDKSLNFDLIMALGLMSSHAQLIHIEKIKEKTPIWEMQGAMDWQMSLKAELLDSQQKRDTQSFDFKGQGFSGGLSKPLLLTGTQFSVSYFLNQKDPQNIGMGAAFLSPSAEWDLQGLSFNVSQPLLKNAFGTETRHRWQAAQKAHQLHKLRKEQRLEELHASFLENYYGGWQAQRQVVFAKEQVLRQRRLLEVVKKKFQLGTVTEDDLLQMRSGLLQAENALTQSQVQLQSFWHGLVINLHLPLHWTEQVDPLWVPMKIEQRGRAALNTCQRTLQNSSRNASSAHHSFRLPPPIPPPLLRFSASTSASASHARGHLFPMA